MTICLNQCSNVCTWPPPTPETCVCKARANQGRDRQLCKSPLAKVKFDVHAWTSPLLLADPLLVLISRPLTFARRDDF